MVLDISMSGQLKAENVYDSSNQKLLLLLKNVFLYISIKN